mmetsp:Transcript_9164/g.20025  ORF Transcript_9164/g.20025 Transcript_9164/m.20025 type:complete len:82 (+) Transcript_9164:782-1027(+)
MAVTNTHMECKQQVTTLSHTATGTRATISTVNCADIFIAALGSILMACVPCLYIAAGMTSFVDIATAVCANIVCNLMHVAV